MLKTHVERVKVILPPCLLHDPFLVRGLITRTRKPYHLASVMAGHQVSDDFAGNRLPT